MIIAKMATTHAIYASLSAVLVRDCGLNFAAVYKKQGGKREKRDRAVARNPIEYPKGEPLDYLLVSLVTVTFVARGHP